MADSLNNFKPEPGYVIGRPIKREELQASGLSLPSNVGKVSDNVAMIEVIATGLVRKIRGDWEYPIQFWEPESKDYLANPLDLEAGDIVGYMPYTDKLIEIDMKIYAVVPYKQIMIRKKAQNV